MNCGWKLILKEVHRVSAARNKSIKLRKRQTSWRLPVASALANRHAIGSPSINYILRARTGMKS